MGPGLRGSSPSGRQEGQPRTEHVKDLFFIQSGAGTIGSSHIKVAFIGDQGINTNSKKVLELIRDEGADMVLHQGDLGYGDESDPEAATKWNNQINAILGSDFPYFASIGNHDQGQWSVYQLELQERLDRNAEATCTGDLGVKSTCHYKGLFFILSGAGTRGSGHADFIKDQLAQNDSIWSICSWHKNQREMQVGGKSSEVGWGPYEECRKGGAIIATGHEHSYHRTKTLSNMTNQTVDPSCLDSPDTPDRDVCVSPGSTFAFVSGLGGASIRNQELDGNWWSSIYVGPQFGTIPGRAEEPYGGCIDAPSPTNPCVGNAKPGALFVTFNVDGDPRKAVGEFKAIEKESRTKNLLPPRRRNLLILGFIVGFFAGGITVVTFVSFYFRKLQSGRRTS